MTLHRATPTAVMIPINASILDWSGTAFCVAFPFWVVLVMMVLTKYIKKPGEVHDPERQHGFPMASNVVKEPTDDSSTKSSDPNRN